jgi:hypothetical protein
MPDHLLVGWKNISRFLGCSERKAKARKKELEDCGAIFYQLLGSPPRRRVCAFTEILMHWATLKSKKAGAI